MVIWKHLSACREHSNSTRIAFASESDWHFNCDLEHQNACREHSNCARNAFVSESNWQAHAFKWSFGAPKMHFMSIQTEPDMFLLLSRTGKQMHSYGHFEHQSTFPEHSNCLRNANARDRNVQYQNRQAIAFQQAPIV